MNADKKTDSEDEKDDEQNDESQPQKMTLQERANHDGFAVVTKIHVFSEEERIKISDEEWE